MLLIKNTRPWARTIDEKPIDMLLDDTKIIARGEHLTTPDGTETIDAAGAVALPSLGDTHAHLDSTRLGLPFRPHTADGTLESLIENDLTNWRSAEKSVTWRATHTLGKIIASGATLIHTHAQVDPYSKLDRLEGILAAKETHRQRARVQIVAFPQTGIVCSPGTEQLLVEALQNGADLIGGIDPCGLDKDPVAHLDVVFKLAERFGVGADIHLHERGTLGAFSLGLIAERVKALGMQGKVAISHAFALVTQPSESAQRKLIELLAEHDIAVATIAPAGCTLPIKLLKEAGVRCGLGEDGMRDYWSPYGDGDVLRRAWQLAYQNNFSADADVELALETASLGGRALVDGTAAVAPQLEHRGLGVGDPADILLVVGDTATAALMDCSPQRTVVHRGRIVAKNGELL